MSDILSIEEIEARYTDGWILIAEPETDDHQHLLSGRVIFHSLDREEVDRRMLELRLSRLARRYMGEYPEHMAINL